MNGTNKGLGFLATKVLAQVTCEICLKNDVFLTFGDVVIHLGKHIYESRDEVLPHRVFNVDQPPLKAVVDCNVYAVGHKLVRLHLQVIVGAMLEDMWICGTLSSSKDSRRIRPGSHSVMKVPST